MNRKETTQFLGELLISQKFHRKIYAREVSLDYGTVNVRRVDFIEFEPAGVVFQSDIEKGIFSCYEVKSCKEDVYSGNGLNFVGEKNYIVTTMQCYKDIQEDLRNGRLHNHIKNCNPESSPHFGIIVPVPEYVDVMSEFENPSQFGRSCSWKMHTILSCHLSGRKRSTTELLFCMLRSGR